jgi:hypothetical protein
LLILESIEPFLCLARIQLRLPGALLGIGGGDCHPRDQDCAAIERRAAPPFGVGAVSDPCHDELATFALWECRLYLQ